MRSRSLVVLGLAAGILFPAGASAAEAPPADASRFSDTQQALTEIANETSRLQTETDSGLGLPAGIINNPALVAPAPLPAPTANRRPGEAETVNRRSPGWLLEARDAAEAADGPLEEEDLADDSADADNPAGQVQNEPDREDATINPLNAYMSDWLTDSDFRMLSDFNPEFSQEPTVGLDPVLGLGGLPSPTPGLTTGLTGVAGLTAAPRSVPSALTSPAENPFLAALEAPSRPANPALSPVVISPISAGTLPAATPTPEPDPIRNATPVSPLRPPAEPDYFPQLNRF